jgi:hypothetical protein
VTDPESNKEIAMLRTSTGKVCLVAILAVGIGVACFCFRKGHKYPEYPKISTPVATAVPEASPEPIPPGKVTGEAFSVVPVRLFQEPPAGEGDPAVAKSPGKPGLLSELGAWHTPEEMKKRVEAEPQRKYGIWNPSELSEPQH